MSIPNFPFLRPLERALQWFGFCLPPDPFRGYSEERQAMAVDLQQLDSPEAMTKEVERLRNLCHRHISEKSALRLELMDAQFDLELERNRSTALAAINQYATHGPGCLHGDSRVEIGTCSCGLFDAVHQLEKSA